MEQYRSHSDVSVWAGILAAFYIHLEGQEAFENPGSLLSCCSRGALSFE